MFGHTVRHTWGRKSSRENQMDGHGCPTLSLVQYVYKSNHLSPSGTFKCFGSHSCKQLPLHMTSVISLNTSILFMTSVIRLLISEVHGNPLTWSASKSTKRTRISLQKFQSNGDNVASKIHRTQERIQISS